MRCTFDRQHVHDLCERLTVEQIAELRDPVLRNVLITHSYHLLSRQVAAIVGDRDANWLTFAAWASAQAGRCIRKEAVAIPGWRHLPIAAAVSRHIAHGNLKVYAEIALVFRDFVAWIEGEETRGRELRGMGETELRARIAEALELDPRSFEHKRGGQALLVTAFYLYTRAAYEEDDDRRAEYIFVANSHVGLHEQQRLEPQIGAALNATSFDRVLERVAAWWSKTVASQSLFISNFSVIVRALVERLHPRRIATRLFMTLPLSREDLALGIDLPKRPGHESLFPDHLKVFDNQDADFQNYLLQVLSYDQTPDSLGGSGADDWTRLEDRMNYILDFFRSRQKDETLFVSPIEVDPAFS